jgi:hypothetical protein
LSAVGSTGGEKVGMLGRDSKGRARTASIAQIS